MNETKTTTVLCLPRELLPGHVIVRGSPRVEQPGKIVMGLIYKTVVGVTKPKDSPFYRVVLDDRTEPYRWASGRHIAVTAESYYRIQRESEA